MPRGDGVTQVFFLDPDGYVLEYFQRTGEDQSDARRARPWHLEALREAAAKRPPSGPLPHRAIRIRASGF